MAISLRLDELQAVMTEVTGWSETQFHNMNESDKELIITGKLRFYILLFFLLTLPGIRFIMETAKLQDIPEDEWSKLRAVATQVFSLEQSDSLERRITHFKQHIDAVRNAFFQEQARNRIFQDFEEHKKEFRRLTSQGLEILQSAQEERRNRLEEMKVELDVVADFVGLVPSRGLVPDLAAIQPILKVRLLAARRHLARGEVEQIDQILSGIRNMSSELRQVLDQIRMRYEDPDTLSLWERLCDEALESSHPNDRYELLVIKESRRAFLLRKGKVVHRLLVDLGRNGLFDKARSGDGATPEGHYQVSQLKSSRETNYHRALLLDYPNEQDREVYRQAVAANRIDPEAGIGGLIEIHGNGGRGRDWTDGCLAISDSDMDLLFGVAYKGMPVTVVGKCSSIH